MAHFGDARDQIGSRPTMPARTRDGKNYPGGKHMRRALKRLLDRRGSQVGKGADHGHSRQPDGNGVTAPGSMA